MKGIIGSSAKSKELQLLAVEIIWTLIFSISAAVSNADIVLNSTKFPEELWRMVLKILLALKDTFHGGSVSRQQRQHQLVYMNQLLQRILILSYQWPCDSGKSTFKY